ncbi:26S proteasome regulatory complex, subunit PSMD10 [Handroanthus impetiginosus]|uniref:26S proteasome regulatory complex, subunit PSMD10 n=1 Tax=Handroanthus impetiginosus TaxID=429701 RepID=A0A2G9G5R9_9LAMI|nr:26S proteasome regulatory complex, subunit PSMD10 [Handroanthus impetiginosus]
MAERRLYDAAAKRDEKALHELLQQDPLLVNRVSYTSPNKTPLHIATIHGHLPFVEQILNQSPHLAEELDSQQSSALHVASAKGYVEILKKLLSAAPDMCLSRDSLGRNPLHLAAIKGHVQVLEVLLGMAPFTAGEKMDRGLSLLHLCVKFCQFEALKFLVPKMNELLNSKDDINGDTILHMAVRGKQIEAINFLLTVAELEVNALNLNGMTALDVLIQSKWDFRDSEIKESLKRAGALGASKTNTPLHNNSWKRLFQNQAEWLEKKKSALMVVASLIATMAFQVGVNPPGGVWQDDKVVDSQGNQTISDHTHQNHSAGYSIMASNEPEQYMLLYIVNTISFIASLSIILLLMSGLPIRQKFSMWILMVITWISITTIALTYLESTYSLIPPDADDSAVYVISQTVKVWIGLMALLLIGHTIRFIIRLVKKLRRILRTRQSRMVAGSAVLGNTVFGLKLFLVCISILTLVFLSVFIAFQCASDDA